MKTWLGLLAAAVLAGACTSGPHASAPRQSITRQIADDAAEFNEAYGQAVSSQILLNILRSRDRLPRYYLSMTGISDSPSWAYTQSAGIGSVPLGGSIGTPWGVGNVGVERSTETRPSYAVQPFDAQTLNRTAFEPTATHVFAHYWRSGWPRDLLLLVMVEQMEVTEAGRTRVFTNEANTIFEDCALSVDTDGCAFVRQLRSVLTSTEQTPRGGIDRVNGRPLCGLIDAYGAASAVRPVTPTAELDCDPVFAIGASVVRLRLRSLDDIVYYVGELMRAGAMNAEPGEAIEAQVTVRAAGLRGGGRGVPLFRIMPHEAVNGGIYAAQTSYGGERFFAGPAIGRSCGAVGEGVCADTPDEGDRSSSVLSLIAEILALNQSPDSIRAPNRLIAE